MKLGPFGGRLPFGIGPFAKPQDDTRITNLAAFERRLNRVATQVKGPHTGDERPPKMYVYDFMLGLTKERPMGSNVLVELEYDGEEPSIADVRGLIRFPPVPLRTATRNRMKPHIQQFYDESDPRFELDLEGDFGADDGMWHPHLQFEDLEPGEFFALVRRIRRDYRPL